MPAKIAARPRRNAPAGKAAANGTAAPPDYSAFATEPCGGGVVGSHPALPGVTFEACFFKLPYAQEFLKRNDLNRTVRERAIEGQWRDLLAGHWPFTGDSICFDINGDAVDGQHRALDVVKAAETARAAGMPEEEVNATVGMWTLVVRGLDPDVRNYKDLGTKRTAGDHIQLLDLDDAPSGAALASLSRYVFMWEHAGTKALPGSGKIAPTEREARETFLAHSGEIIECVRFAKDLTGKAKSLHVRPRAAGMALWLFCHSPKADHQDRDKSAGRHFMERFGDGAQLQPGDPILDLRERFQRQGASQKLRDRKLTELEQLAALILGFNAWQAGDQLEDYKRPEGGQKAANMPDVVYALAAGLRVPPSAPGPAVNVPIPAFTA